MLILKVLRIFYVAAYLFFFGCVATALKPFGSKRIEELKQKGRELNTNAAKKIGASSLFVTLANGIKLHVVEAGDKRSKKMIVLLHGFPDTWHCWSGVIPDLVKEGYFVVAPDMRGYNLSEKPKSCNDYRINVLINDVKELIESYGKKSCNVAGHDWGGVVAWNLVDRHPEVVDKLVILNAPYTKAYQHVVRKNINQMLSSWYILFFQIPFIPVNLISYFPDQAAKTFIKTRREGKVSKEDYELLASAYAQENASMSMLYYYKAMVRGEVSNALKKRSQPKRERIEVPEKIKVPSLILWGQNDVALVSELAMCARWVENPQVIYIPDCSHWVPYEVPEIISREIIKFIA